jgi:hypothetical protein
MKREPVVIINALVALVEAIIALAVGFGLNLTKEQVGLVMAVVVAIGNLVQTILARGQVTPVADPRNNLNERLVPEVINPTAAKTAFSQTNPVLNR